MYYHTYGYESWTVKKAESRRIDAFELWCWRRLLRVPWTARRSNQSILKEISPGCSLEGLMLKLKLQYFGRLMRRADSFEKALMLGTKVKSLPANAEDADSTPGSGRSPGVGNGNSLQYSCLEKSHGQRRTLVGYSLWGHKELDMTE